VDVIMEGLFLPGEVGGVPINVDPGGVDPAINPMGGLFECRPDSLICVGSGGVRFPRFETQTTVAAPAPGLGTLIGRSMTSLTTALSGPLILVIVALVVGLAIIRRVG
jgi:hypothetical protein